MWILLYFLSMTQGLPIKAEGMMIPENEYANFKVHPVNEIERRLISIDVKDM